MRNRFLFVGLSSDEWVFEFRADSYQPARMNRSVQRLSANRPIQVVLTMSGRRFLNETEFEAEGGTAKITFSADGSFAFDDANGDGEGTYGIVEQSAVMIIRDYDGPDDTYSVNAPVVVTFADDQFTSLTVPLRDRCSFGRFTWLISKALTVTYVVLEHRLYLERNCRLPESGPQETAESRGACQFQGAEQSAGFGPAVEPRRK